MFKHHATGDDRHNVCLIQPHFGTQADACCLNPGTSTNDVAKGFGFTGFLFNGSGLSGSLASDNECNN